MNKIKNLLIPKNKWQRFLLFLLLLFYGYILAQKINFTTADLGRHLKNGELFFKEHIIPNTNLYSYTYPNYPFVNHHWGSGAIFYLIKMFFGFTGLSIFFIVLSLFTFLLFFNIAWKYSRFEFAMLISIVIIPILGSRTEIRPEVFSYFLSGLFFWLLSNYKSNRISPRLLFFLPLLELIWVNLHIYFPIGILLIGLFLLEEFFMLIIQKKRNINKHMKILITILILSILAIIFNPAGITGAIYPLKIFEDYGYRLIENQSVWFIEKLITYPPIRYFKIVFVLLSASWLFKLRKIIKQRNSFPIVNLLLTLLFSFLGWTAIRNFTIFGYFALPITAINLRNINILKRKTKDDYFLVIISAVFLFLAIVVINPQYWSTKKILYGFGLRKRVENAALFFKKENIQGSIFNNYDIGSYLIYYLYPEQRVFVDNRPEAYPASFFKKIYIPLQENEQKWKEIDKRYNFNVIFFYRHDATPWGQNFLVKRVFDPKWAPVYVDEYCIILLKRNGVNKPTIQKYELPKEIFSVRKPS